MSSVHEGAQQNLPYPKRCRKMPQRKIPVVSKLHERISSMKKRQDKPQMEIQEREPARPGTIGVIFDYYREKGLDRLPEGVIVNADKWKSNKIERRVR